MGQIPMKPHLGFYLCEKVVVLLPDCRLCSTEQSAADLMKGPAATIDVRFCTKHRDSRQPL